MSFDFRFEPPTGDELDEMGYSSCPFDFKCRDCEYDCSPEDFEEEEYE